MKKLTTLLLIICLIFSLTGCSKTTLEVDGKYWQANPTTYEVDEVLEYGVEVTNQTFANKNVIKNDNIKLEITDSANSYFRTAITDGVLEGKRVYKYTTKLQIVGRYTIIDKNVQLDYTDVIETETIFNADTTLAPITSKKIVKSNVPGTDKESGEYKLFGLEYDYTITYQGKNATLKFNETKDEGNILNKQKEEIYKNYNESAYLDNELLLFMPRGYKLISKDSFSVTFTTIDGLSGVDREMRLTTMFGNKTSSSTHDIKVDNYVFNGSPVADKTFKTVRAEFTLTSLFEGTPIECYYAYEEGERNKMVVCFSSVYPELGYLKYTLRNTQENK